MEMLPSRLHHQVEEMRLASVSQKMTFNNHMAEVWDYMQTKVGVC